MSALRNEAATEHSPRTGFVYKPIHCAEATNEIGPALPPCFLLILQAIDCRTRRTSQIFSPIRSTRYSAVNSTTRQCGGLGIMRTAKYAGFEKTALLICLPTLLLSFSGHWRNGLQPSRLA